MDVVKIHYWVSTRWRYKKAIAVILTTPESPMANDIHGVNTSLKIGEN